MLEKIRPIPWLLALCLLGLVMGACSSDSMSPAAPAPTEPGEGVETVTDTFRGEMPQAGRSCHDFAISVIGSVTIEITDMKPLISLTVGLGLGQPSIDVEDLCNVFAEDLSVRAFEIFLSEGLAVGPLCICIFDVGNIFPDETISYVLEVIHP